MALTTYAELQQAVSSWLSRADIDEYIPDWVVMFEAHANRQLRTRQMATTATIPMATGAGTLPSDYLSWRRVTWTSDTSRQLEYVTPDYMNAAYPDAGEGLPSVFTIEGEEIKVRPVNDESLVFGYYQRIPPLASSVNWLFSKNPDAYLFGTLVEASDFLEDDTRLLKYKVRRDEVLSEVQRVSSMSRGPSTVRVMGVTP